MKRRPPSEVIVGAPGFFETLVQRQPWVLALANRGSVNGFGARWFFPIAQLIRARIRVVSQREAFDTSFRVSLPPATQAASPRIVPSPKPGTRGRILVVDDEPAILRALVHLLRGAHEVVAVSSPKEALAKIEAGARFDVILCNLMMPRMTGMELHDALIRIAPAQASRLVGMTGSGFTAEAREFVARQRPLLEKPFELAQLNVGRREQG